MLNRNFFEALTPWHEKLKNSGQPVFVYGMGDGCNKVLSAFEAYGISCEGIFASDGFQRGQEFAGFKVETLAQIEEKYPEFSVAVAFGTSLPDVMGRIKSIAMRHSLVFPDVPVVGDEIFSKAEFLRRFEQAEEVYSLLADEKSRQVFRQVVAFKITGDISCLNGIFTAPDEAFDEILRLGQEEIYVDLGAYTGDTVLDFVNRVGGAYRRIYAVEPNKKNFRKCLKNTLNFENISLYNSPAWSHDRLLKFTDGAGRQQQISQNGRLVWARSVDSILDGRECTFIKYDVEGADLEAILGSRHTIEAYSPKICTALYHRAFDLLDLPVALKKINGDYRFFMRQYPYYPAWETNLFCIK